MNREQKKNVVNEFKEKFEKSQATFLVGYKGLKVSQIQDLRNGLRQKDGEFRITKARLMKLAAQDSGVDGIDKFKDLFSDQIGLVFVQEDIPGVAKTLVDFSRKEKILDVISGLFNNGILSREEISYLATLPSREILLAQVVGTIQAPIRSFVRLLNLLIVRLLYVLKKIAEKNER